MLKKTPFAFNLFLIALFTYRIFALYGELGYEEEHRPKAFAYTFVDINRPVQKATRQQRNIFGLRYPDIVKSVNTSVTGNSKLNELVTGGEVIRLRGIFISEDQRYAVISISDKKKKHAEKPEKVGIGDTIRDYILLSVRPDSIVLADGSSDESDKVVLRIF